MVVVFKYRVNTREQEKKMTLWQVTDDLARAVYEAGKKKKSASCE